MRNKTFIDGLVFGANLCLVISSVFITVIVFLLSYYGKLDLKDIIVMIVLELVIELYVNLVYLFRDLFNKFYMLFGKYRWLL